MLASCWSSHTLVSYPLFRRAGAVANRAVTTTVGATIMTDTAALLVLAVVAAAQRGSLGWTFWATLLPSLVVLVGFTSWLLPRVTRWAFATFAQDRALRFPFLLAAMFTTAGLAELAGIEAIVGAFLAGASPEPFRAGGQRDDGAGRVRGVASAGPLAPGIGGMLIDPAEAERDPRSWPSPAGSWPSRWERS